MWLETLPISFGSFWRDFDGMTIVKMVKKILQAASFFPSHWAEIRPRKRQSQTRHGQVGIKHEIKG